MYPKNFNIFSNYYFISRKKYHIYIEKIPAVQWQRQQGKIRYNPLIDRTPYILGFLIDIRGSCQSLVRNLHEEDVYSIGCTSSFYFADTAFYGIYVLSTALVLTVEQEEPRWA